MASDLGLLSLDQLQRLAQSHQHQQQNPNLTEGPWMWNTRQNQEDDDSWEVRAFAQDTSSILGTTWPPRSYTCTFCRREFRSAQALGGHMNVHRRDRAKLRQSSHTSSPSFVFPPQEFVPNGGLCLFYSLPSPDTRVLNSASLNVCLESPSTLLSISPYQNNNFVSSSFEPLDSSTASISTHGSLYQTALLESVANQDDKHNFSSISSEDMKEDKEEELDLELRLGSGPAT